MKKVTVLYPLKVVRAVRINIDKVNFFKFKVTYEYLNTEGEVLRESIEYGNWFTIMPKLDNSIGWLYHQYGLKRNRIYIYSESRIILDKLYKKF